MVLVMTKLEALEFLAKQMKPLTAKEMAIDLDVGQATASELLERMAAQGLVQRDKNERPREYALTAKGRERLDLLRASAGQRSVSKARAQPKTESNPRPSTNVNPHTVPLDLARVEKLEARQKEFEQRLAGFEEDFEEMLASLAGATTPPDARPQTVAERAKELLQRANELTQVEEDEADPHVIELYEAQQKLTSLGLFDDKGPLKKRVAELEAELEPETVEKVKRLIELETNWYGPSGKEQDEIVRLREELGLPVESETEETVKE